MNTYETTVSMLKMLSENDLKVIQSVVAVFLEKYELFQPQTESQLIDSIDTAIDHAHQGMTRDARAISAELREKYGI